MKRYSIYAKRKDEPKWTAWTDTDDITQIEKHIKRIRELGYEAKVTDPAIEWFEKNIDRGYILETPVAIGQTVYAVVYGYFPKIMEWEVKELHYDGEKWYAIGDDGDLNEVGSSWCLTSKSKAEKLLEELTGESEYEQD